jgi:hypothetical protein
VFDKAQPPLRNIIIKDRQSGFIDFSRMKGRPKFTTLQPQGNPHAKRFNNFNAFPTVSTKSRYTI